MSKNSATYWVNTIKTLTSALEHCQAQNRSVYSSAIRFANKKLKLIRQKAGIYL